ncbi:hypothetical protein LWI28_000314 [Acer negundo]|uniref:Uncharacterized protein n=1 Tax=Acer negundo TaxID=4023 RepID=A0AAD5JC03_ACENE|nr:hypothetical protein LWI28_000314 [Acer negundo]
MSQQVLNSQEHYIRDAIGSPLLPSTVMPPQAVIIGEESFHGISNLSFKIYLARPALVFNSDAILALYSGNTKFMQGLQVYLLSRDYSNLKSDFQIGKGKITVSCIENQPAVNVALGEHMFLTTNSIQVSNVSFVSVHGTSASEQAITLDCSGSAYGCSNIVMSGVNTTSSNPGKEVRALCKNAHGTSHSTTYT